MKRLIESEQPKSANVDPDGDEDELSETTALWICGLDRGNGVAVAGDGRRRDRMGRGLRRRRSNGVCRGDGGLFREFLPWLGTHKQGERGMSSREGKREKRTSRAGRHVDAGRPDLFSKGGGVHRDERLMRRADRMEALKSGKFTHGLVSGLNRFRLPLP